MVRIEQNKDMSALNTFGMKVSAGCFVEYDSIADLEEMDFDSLPTPVKHIGAGSNLLFTGDFKGTLLHSGIRYIKEIGSHDGDVMVEAGAGVVFDDLIEWACSMGLWGAENLSLIPGEVGASAVQNIGAYGVEAKDIIIRVTCFDRKRRELVTFENSQCRYGYRESFFKNEDKEGRYIVVSVLFRFSTEPSPKLDYGNIREALGDREANCPKDIRDTIIAIRNSKLPDPAVTGSAGSFFKNPVVSEESFRHICEVAGPEVKVPHFVVDGGIKVPAAWLIDKSGFRGSSNGGAAVYEKQPLVIVNASGEASPEEIIALERRIMEGVKAKFGVELHPEVEHL